MTIAYSWREPFLVALRLRPILTYALDCVGVSYGTVHNLLRTDKEFKKQVDEAMAEARDRLQIEAYKRAFEGIWEPVISQGRLAMKVVMDEHGQPVIDETTGKPKLEQLFQRKFSDTLALAMLKANLADYRVERTELTGSGGEPLLIDETTRAARLKALLDKAKERKDAPDTPINPEDFG